MLANDHHEGATLADFTDATDAELADIWDAVHRLHAHRVTHRSLTADRICLPTTGSHAAQPGRWRHSGQRPADPP